MQQALADFLRCLALERNASPHTVKSYREDLQQALEFFEKSLGTPTAPVSRIGTRNLVPPVATSSVNSSSPSAKATSSASRVLPTWVHRASTAVIVRPWAEPEIHR